MRKLGALAIAVLVGVAPACSRFGAHDHTELCQDLTNLAATVAFLETPPRNATVGDVRGALDKLDGTLAAVHDDPDVPDAQDDALLQSQDDYRTVIEGVGDDDPFSPYVAASQGIAEGLVRSYQSVRASLDCPTYLQPG
jgi:hypothetical protein